MSSESKNQLDQAFEMFEAECGENKIIRKEMIESLRKAIANPEMAISPYDKAMTMSAKVSIYKTLDDLLKSDEGVSIQKLKMKLARKDTETNGMVGQTIVNLLRSVRVTGESTDNAVEQNKDQAMAELSKLATEQKDKLAIDPGELSECTATGDAPPPPPEEKEDEE